DARRQRRLPVIDMPDRSHVHVRLRSLVFLFRHVFLLEPSAARLSSRLELKRRASVSVRTERGTGFEPATNGLGGRGSSPLGYPPFPWAHHQGWTCDPGLSKEPPLQLTY